jgi:hypothetical protein
VRSRSSARSRPRRSPVRLRAARHEQPPRQLARRAELAEALRAPDSLAIALEGLAALALRRDDHASAVRLVGAAQRMSEESGYVLEAAEQALHDRTLAGARSALGEAALADALAAGGSLSFDGAAAAARDAAPGRPAAF